MIYRCGFMRCHIDLSKIVSIGSPKLHWGPTTDPLGQVSFEIIVQLRDAPIVFSRDLLEGEEARWLYARPEIRCGVMGREMTWSDKKPENIDDVIAVQRLQSDIDGLIAAWQLSK